jgi:hypothetical protein
MYVDFLTVAVFAMIVITIGLQVVATRRVRRDASFAPEQRKAQLWMIWLLPILGASIVLSVLHDEPPAERDRQDQRHS